MIRRHFGVPCGDQTRLVGETLVPEGPPPRSGVVLVHGFRAFKDWAFLPWLATELAGRGHMVARFSFTGCGVGPTGDEITDLEAFQNNTISREVDELHKMLAACDTGDLFPRPPRRISLVGHGRGGGAALIATAEAGRVSHLATLSTMYRFDRWKPETVAEWRSNGVTYVLDTRSGRQLPIGLGLLDDFEDNRERLDLLKAASEVRVPWLVLHGEEDLTVPVDDARMLARAGQNTRMKLIDGAGHLYGVRHPMGDPTPALRTVAERVMEHLEN